MITVNSVSGGKSSAYIYAEFPAAINIFSLVRIENPKFLWLQGKDEKTRQLISDRIGTEFIGTAEMDEIIYTILDLEQLYGREIKIISPVTFEDIIRKSKGFLPSPSRRFCTTGMKIEPIFNYLYDNDLLPVITNIGFRKGEERRQKKSLKRLESDGFEYMYKRTTKKPNSRYYNREHVRYRTVEFPLIDNNITASKIEQYWSDKNIRFAVHNNCVGCMNRSPLLLNHMSKLDPNGFDVFIYLENFAKEIRLKRGISGNVTFRPEGSMYSFANPKIDFGLFDSDFNECDSGYCGL